MTNGTEKLRTRRVQLELDWESDAGYVELTHSSETRLRQVVIELEDLSFELVLDISHAGGLLGIEVIGIDAAFEGGRLFQRMKKK